MFQHLSLYALRKKLFILAYTLLQVDMSSLEGHLDSRHQWYLENSTSIKLQTSFAVTETKIMALCSIWRTQEYPGLPHLSQISGVKHGSRRCYKQHAQSCRHLPALRRQKHSRLNYFSSCYPVCHFIRSLTKETDSCLSHYSFPVFILICLLQPFDAADEEEQQQSMWTIQGQPAPSSKKLSGSEAETVCCVSDLWAAHLLVKDGWRLCHLC